LGVYTSVSNLVKIDEEMRPLECPQTDRHTHAQTQNDFIIYPMLCYSYGADNNSVVNSVAPTRVHATVICFIARLAFRHESCFTKSLAECV